MSIARGNEIGICSGGGYYVIVVGISFDDARRCAWGYEIDSPDVIGEHLVRGAIDKPQAFC